MDRVSVEQIYKKCPLIFRGREAGIDKNLMASDFSCDDGWSQIIDELSVQIEAIARSLKEGGLEDEYLPLVQVKEKFGTLRYYMRYSTDEIEALIHQATKKSAVTCECCGAKDTFLTGGYILVLCDECYLRANSNRGES